MRYIPNSPEERQEMLHALGLNSAEELFDSIPADALLREPLKTPAALSEIELLERFESLASRNAAARRPSFLGAGAYSHYAPTIVDSLIQRSEFFTAYTPYQPEISQGTLQAIFEFQTLVCQLTGMDVANASMYDGSTAMAEAVLMAERVTRRSRVLVSDAVHPEYMQVTETYVAHAGIELGRLGVDAETGRTAFDDSALDKTVGAVVVQSPNFFGCVEDLKSLADRAHAAGALLVVVVTESASFGLLRPPGACGADIVAAEGQSLGVPLSFTNEGLIALAATIYMTTMGRKGLQEVAAQCAQKAAYARRRIAAVEGFSLPYSAPVFNEFVVRAPLEAAGLLRRLASEHNVNGGLALSRHFPERPNDLLVCVTETNKRSEIDALVAGLREVQGSRFKVQS
ncbi:MAG: aminomethyl-transferring glycine dehydrogenase subunit GcvPA [Acidobacteria bacterium]|nr:MAG: aminomethyl-transferring glycine dehydrogenase subunit GcvPA [Acidobacteriota bacterium]